MSAPFDVLMFDDALHAWRNLKTGRMVSGAMVQAEVDRHIAAGQELMQALTKRYYAGEISLAEWKLATAAELRDMHSAFAMLGAGGRDNMTASMWGRVGGNLSDEYRHLQQFAEAIGNETVSEAQALARITQYGNSSKQAYWDVFKETAAPAENPDLPLLTNSPRDGGTQCRGNCNCEIVPHADGSADWVLHDGEHCDDCEALASGGPYRLN